MSRENIQRLISIQQNRLHKLQEQQAQYGLDTPPHISNEIETIKTYLVELQKEKDQMPPSYSLLMTTPTQARTLSVAKIRRKILTVTGTVDPIPETKVWIIRQMTMRQNLRKIEYVDRVYAFEADIDKKGIWKCQVKFFLWRNYTQMHYKIWAVIPSQDGRLLFKHQYANREKIDEIVAKAAEKGCKFKASYVPLSKEDLPNMLACTEAQNVIMRRKKQ